MSQSVDQQQFHLSLPAQRSDDGLFGPGSVSWKVWSHPAMIPGVMRSFVLDMVASPHAPAAMEDHSRYREDPIGRLNRTLFYFLTTVFADRPTVAAANLRLERMHARVTGTEPMTGSTYAALDPYLQAGNYLLTWHSVYYAYEKLVGPLPEAEQTRFFTEAGLAFEQLGVDYDDIRASAERHGIAPDRMPDRLPVTRAEIRELWDASKHLICVNAQTRRSLDAILHPKANGDLTKAVVFRAYPALARAGNALIPREIRRTAGISTSRVGDAAAIAAARVTVGTLHRTNGYSPLLQALCPQGHEIQTRALDG